MPKLIHRVRCLSLAMACLSLTVGATGQVPNVTNATIRGWVSAPDRITVEITNNGRSPLEAWELTASYPIGQLQAKVVHVTVDTFRTRYSRGPVRSADGPIAVGERRSFEYPVQTTGQGAVDVRLLMTITSTFDIDGDLSTADQVIDLRRADAREADYWVRVLGDLSGVSPSLSRSRLASRLNDRPVAFGTSREDAAQNQAAGVIRQTLEQLLRTSDAQYPGVLTALLAGLTRQRDVAAQYARVR